MRKILQIDNPADSIAESAGFPLLGAVHPQVEGVGDVYKRQVLRNRKKHRKMLLQKRAELERLRRKQYDIKL